MKILILFSFIVFTFATTSQAKSIFTFAHDIKVRPIKLTKELPQNHLALFKPI
jgi:hypothetical protein